jgi:hypothetical protein
MQCKTCTTRKLYICYKGAPTTNSRNLKYTSSSNTPFRKALFTSIWYNLNPLVTEKARRILIASKRSTGANVSSLKDRNGEPERGE